LKRGQLVIVLIKAAINGGRSKAEHAAVPVSPEEQAAAVVECLKAGAAAIHLHVRITRERQIRSSTGEDFGSAKESLDSEDVARTLLAVRAAAPKASIGISTGAWILPDPDARHRAVAAWQVLPAFASVNFSEVGSVELARLFLSRGVEVEAGLCDAAAAEVLVNSGLAAKCFRVLLEPQEQTMNQALETVGGIERVLNSAALQLPPLLLHGTEATVWPMIDEAIGRGYDSRVGLEDTLVLPDGSPARDNVELVIEAVRRGQAAGRAVSGE
jgi:uncharacterized protein (DUF849 family)